MVLRPLRRTPMMLGGVGFQIGLDEARRKQIETQRQAAEQREVIKRLQGLKALLDDGTLTPDEFRIAKQKVLGS